MPLTSIKFQYQTGVVTGGYSFSAYNNIITLSGYVEKLENAKIREAIQYEAKTARSFYVDEVNRLKANGEKVNSFIVKQEATRKAKDIAQTKYAEIWSEVEDVYKNPPLLAEKTGNTKIYTNITRLKDVEFFVAVSGSENLFNRIMETIELCREYDKPYPS